MSIKQNTQIAMAIGSGLNINAETDHALFKARETIKDLRKVSREVEKHINSDIATCRKGGFTKSDFFETSHKKEDGSLYVITSNNLFAWNTCKKQKVSYSKIDNRSAVFAELRKNKSLDVAMETFFDIAKCSKFAMAMLAESLKSDGTFDTQIKHVSAITKLCSQKTGVFSFNPASVKTKITLTIDVAPIASGEQKVEDCGVLASDALQDYLFNKKNVAKLLSAFPRNTHAVIKKAFKLK